MKKNRAIVAEHVEIRIAIVIIVAHGHAHAKKTFGANTALFSYIRKGSISVVPIQGVSKPMRRIVNLRCRTVDQIQIQQSILIVINPPAPRANGFNKVFLGSGGVVVAECNPRLMRDIPILHLYWE
ncbi:MAG: hypothetical protein DMG21_06920 [Acidobacteria bacterium]|nr:MAG: hypothetical protein DMG21_06920 [Acidobacteriota bacterium]